MLRPCIMWNDGRAAQECADLTARADFPKGKSAANLVMAGFTAPKLLWVQRHRARVSSTRFPACFCPRITSDLWLTGETCGRDVGCGWHALAGRGRARMVPPTCWRRDKNKKILYGLTEAQMPSPFVERHRRQRHAAPRALRGMGALPPAPSSRAARATTQRRPAAWPSSEDGCLRLAVAHLGRGLCGRPRDIPEPTPKQGVHFFCHAACRGNMAPDGCDSCRRKLPRLAGADHVGAIVASNAGTAARAKSRGHRRVAAFCPISPSACGPRTTNPPARASFPRADSAMSRPRRHGSKGCSRAWASRSRDCVRIALARRERTTIRCKPMAVGGGSQVAGCTELQIIRRYTATVTLL